MDNRRPPELPDFPFGRLADNDPLQVLSPRRRESCGDLIRILKCKPQEETIEIGMTSSSVPIRSVAHKPDVWTSVPRLGHHVTAKFLSAIV